MYTYFEKIPLSEKIAFYAKSLNMPQFDAPRHFHPEYELMCVMQSSGKRFVGDNMAQYEAGDLVLIGPDLPHYWHNDDPRKSNVKAIVVQFRNDFPGDAFLEKLEMQELRRMLDRSRRGIHFSQSAVRKIIPLLENILILKGFDRVMVLLSILNQLSLDKEYELLSSAGFVPENNLYDCEKINRIHQYIIKNYKEQIKIDEAAAIVSMTKSAFCHYFKKRTRKNFSRFVNEMRVGHASKLLVETNNSISEICFQSGFRNLSNFNRRFKEVNSLSPQEYRQQFRQEFITPNTQFS